MLKSCLASSMCSIFEGARQFKYIFSIWCDEFNLCDHSPQTVLKKLRNLWNWWSCLWREKTQDTWSVWVEKAWERTIREPSATLKTCYCIVACTKEIPSFCIYKLFRIPSSNCAIIIPYDESPYLEEWGKKDSKTSHKEHKFSSSVLSTPIDISPR